MGDTFEFGVVVFGREPKEQPKESMYCTLEFSCVYVRYF